MAIENPAQSDPHLEMLHALHPWVLQPPAHPIPPWQPTGHQDFALAKLDALGAALSAPVFLNGAGSMRGMRGGGPSVRVPPTWLQPGVMRGSIPVG